MRRKLKPGQARRYLGPWSMVQYPRGDEHFKDPRVTTLLIASNGVWTSRTD